MYAINSLYMFIIALFTAIIMVPYLQRWAIDTGAVDIPDERKVHKRAVPRIGGVAICIAWLFSLLVYMDMTREVRGILAGSLIIFFTGFIDDLYGLSPKKKFIGQIIACIITITVGHITISSLGNLFGFGTLMVPELLTVPFTILAVVGIINAFNLMDGLDGLAGGISTIALAALLILSYLTDNALMICLCAALLGGVLGFLKYNIHPARIFMGDTGSLLIGFVIAFLTVLLTQSPGSEIQPLIPVLILGLPIADTIRVMGSRMLKRKNPFSPDKTHVHHRFLDLGLDHRHTVTIIYGISLILAGFAILCRAWSGPALLLAFAGAMAAFYTLITLLRHRTNTLITVGMHSMKTLRGTPLFRRLSRSARRIAPVATVLIFVYFLLAAFLCTGIDSTNSVTIQVGGIMLVGSLATLYGTRDIKNHFFMAMLAVSILLITFVLNQEPDAQFDSNILLENLRSIIHLCLLALVGLHLLFREPGEHFLSGLDYLVIGISALIMIIAWQLSPTPTLTLSILKGLNIYLALKVVMIKGKMPAQVILGSVLTVLMVIVVRGVF
ncbi:MAG: MraY family glycosyltransferase [Geobacteraceae bacterium]|nr:MraY family glycosyltransferase [Geobacteraceae bacterium]